MATLFQHQHISAIIIHGNNGTFSHHYSPSDPSPPVSLPFAFSASPSVLTKLFIKLLPLTSLWGPYDGKAFGAESITES